MPLHNAIEDALNRQHNREMAAAYNYLAMTAHFEAMSLQGFAHWMAVQRLEELAHAERIFKYLNDRGGKIVLEGVAQPKTNYETVADVFAAALAQEEGNTAQINHLMKLSREHDDFATQSFLQWFVDEQVEEEQVVGEALSLVQLAGEDRSALLVLNEQFRQRAGESASGGGE